MSASNQSLLRPAAYLTLAGAAAGALFLAFPGIDLAVARLFFRRPGEFVLSDHPVGTLFRHMIPWLTGTMIGGLLLTLAWMLVRRPPDMGGGIRKVVYLILVLAIGPGLIVNALLKEHWHRARPVQVEQFGGRLAFSPPLLITDQCRRNCSFASGDAAIGFSTVAFALLARRRRRALIGAAATFGVAVSLVRMMQGGHFLSDVIFAGFFTLVPALLLYELLIADRWGWFAPRTPEGPNPTSDGTAIGGSSSRRPVLD